MQLQRPSISLVLIWPLPFTKCLSKMQIYQKFAFYTKYGLYEYLTMLMGLSNSPAVLQRLMQIILGSCTDISASFI